MRYYRIVRHDLNRAGKWKKFSIVKYMQDVLYFEEFNQEFTIEFKVL